jgi:hypothetical protein
MPRGKWGCPDTVSTVMRKRRQKASTKPSSAAALAHNLAATQRGVVNNPGQCQNSMGSFASHSARSNWPRSTRASKRLPAEREASVPKSERTTSREDPVSGRLRTEAKAAAAPQAPPTPHRKSTMPSPESSRTHFAGFDWAKQNHYVVIVNAVGQIVAQFGFAHSQAGWQQWREQAARFAPLAVAIETSQGTVIDQLFQTPDCTIYPLNPKAARALPGAQSPQRHQKRPAGRVELCRCPAAGWCPLEAALPPRSPPGTAAAAVPRRDGLD